MGRAAICLTFLLSGLAGGYFLGAQRAKVGKISVMRDSSYTFVHPLLDFQQNGVVFEEILPARKVLQSLADDRIAKGKATHISVYYRDLDNGPWFGINESVRFAPASLLKVPLMLAHLKLAEKDPSHLRKKVKALPLSLELPQTFRSSNPLEEGKEYTIEECIKRMIVNSDNGAANTLLMHIDEASLKSTYQDLRIPFPTGKAADNWITVHEYASFFRVLFNSSYLNRDMSEKALRYLSQTEFKAGIVAGVAPGTVVAHKFGERSSGESQEKQIHDCGVVYYRSHPYLLCVMTRGVQAGELVTVIKDISALVHLEVDGQLRAARK